MRAEWPEAVLSRADQQTAKVGIAGFADPQLRIAIAGLVGSRDQPESWTKTPAFGEARGIFQGEQESQKAEGARALDVLQQLCFGVFGLTQGIDLLVAGADLLGEGGKGLEQGSRAGRYGSGIAGPYFLEKLAAEQEGKRAPEHLTIERTWLMSKIRERTRASPERITARTVWPWGER